MNHYDVLMAAHVLGGGMGLFSLAIPLISKKGGTAHRKAGWIFTVGMTLAGVTGLIVTSLWLIAPLVYKPASSTDPEAIARHLENVRAGAVFLGTLGVLTLNALWQAVRAFSRKRSIEPRPHPIDIALPVILFVSGVGVMTYGLLHSRLLLTIFAVVEMGTAFGDLRFVLRPLSTPMAWWYQHMNGMMTAAIGAVTAFLVFNGHRLLGDELARQWALVLWLSPSAIIVPSFLVWIQRYKRKFHETGSAAAHRGDKVAA